MHPNEYQQLALRTMASQHVLRIRAYEAGVMGTQLDNALRGLMDEVGELAGAIKAWLEYGRPLDPVNLKEEIGDCLWRLSQACDAIGITLEDAMEANIRKLQQRYPDRYTDALAAEESRDRQAERDAMEVDYTYRVTGAAIQMEQMGQGFAEPPEEAEKPFYGYHTIAEYEAATGKKVGDSYSRMCSGCHQRPVHELNSSGLCPDCFQKEKFSK